MASKKDDKFVWWSDAISTMFACAIIGTCYVVVYAVVALFVVSIILFPIVIVFYLSLSIVDLLKSIGG